VFLEGREDVEIIKEKIPSLKNYKIIAFDFHAHVYLKELNIHHQNIEEFFKKNDQENLDSLAVEFAKNWYKENFLREFLEYNGINVGELIEGEAVGYFIGIIRKFKGIQYILENQKPDIIISASLKNFVEYFSHKLMIKSIKFNTKKYSSLAHDQIEIPIKIGNKISYLKFSRKKYIKIKNKIENIVEIIYQLKPNLKNQNQKNILLLDFNPVNYSLLLKELSEKFSNVILLNQRRPAIWNKESLKIVRNSNCKVLRLEKFETNHLKKLIQTAYKQKSQNLENIDESGIKKVFELGGESFWPIIKQDFLKILDKRLEEMIYRYNLINEIFSHINLDCILEWSHKGFEEKILVSIANKKKVPTYYLQHAMDIENSKFDKYIDIRPIGPSNNVKEIVWGNFFKKFLLEKQMDVNEIIVGGSPRHDSFFNNDKKSNESGYVLIAISDFLKFTFNGLDSQKYEQFEKAIVKVIQKIKEQNKKLIIKLHPAPFYYNPNDLIRKIDPLIQIEKIGNTIDLIKSADTVISFNHSTILLESMILKKPTMCISIQEPSIKNESMVTSGSVLFTSEFDEIDDGVKKILCDEDFRKELVENASKHIKNYCANPGTASKEIASILKEKTK